MIGQKWLREPLVHFLLAGAILFAFFAWRGEEADPASRQITVTLEDRAQLALQWERTMQRPPTDAELDSLTETWLREEILYREALRLGLDRDDAVVRKRLANKMDYLAGSIAETAQPTGATLQHWLDDNAQTFATETTYSFDHLYFAQENAARRVLKTIGQGDWRAAGDAIALPATQESVSGRRIEQNFGVVFMENLRGLKPNGTWAGPVASGFGWHLVRLRERRIGEVPPLADIREKVEADWRAATLEARRDKAYRLLRDSYEVTVER